ncbi:glycosyltransferase [Metabacillus indicus]|uniref:glycosyltransferase n=1 Tax=Metabacillus indicus TaxID=246786 RepID=UPI003173C6D8
MSELVSVLMTTYNERIDWIKDAIDSILTQSYRNLELIVVVDNPNSLEIINFLKEYNGYSPKLKVVVNKENMGLAESLNIAFSISTGKYIARMDADDISDITRIEAQVSLLDDNPDVGLVSTQCKYIDESGQIIGEQSIGGKSNEEVKRGLNYINFLIHPSWLLRREVFQTLGGYRNFECSQDYDFLLRMVSENFKIMLYSEKLIRYRVRNNSISSSKSFKQYLIAKYIRNLYHARNQGREDSFSLDNLDKFLKENRYHQDFKKYSTAHETFMGIREKGNLLNKLKAAVKCIFLSKYSRDLLKSSVLFKLVTK